MLDVAADVDLAPEPVAGCTGARALSAKRRGGRRRRPDAVRERARDDCSNDDGRRRGENEHGAPACGPSRSAVGAGRVSAEPPPARDLAALLRALSCRLGTVEVAAGREDGREPARRASVAGRVSESVRALGAGPVPALLQERPEVEGAVLVAALVRAPVAAPARRAGLRASRGGRRGSARRPRGRARRLRGTRARRWPGHLALRAAPPSGTAQRQHRCASTSVLMPLNICPPSQPSLAINQLRLIVDSVSLDPFGAEL